MNTKLLMKLSALLTGAAGSILTFMPDELLLMIGIAPHLLLLIGCQLLGALYLSFAILNWMAKANLMGGIYSRPVAMGNFLHFFMGFMLLFKVLASNAVLPETTTAIDITVVLWIAAGVYGCLALLFALVLFRHPLKQTLPLTPTQ